MFSHRMREAEVADVVISVFVNATNLGETYYEVGSRGVLSIKEIELHGPGDWIPYLRVYFDDGKFIDIPKHNTLCVTYGAPQ